MDNQTPAPPAPASPRPASRKRAAPESAIPASRKRAARNPAASTSAPPNPTPPSLVPSAPALYGPAPPAPASPRPRPARLAPLPRGSPVPVPPALGPPVPPSSVPIAQAEPPPSPWLDKYGGWTGLLRQRPFDGFRHSGFAPSFPWLDPTFFAEDNAKFAQRTPIPRPSDGDLDMLFSSERSQISTNGGMTTWEMALLAQHLVNGWPGGHRPGDPAMQHVLDHGYGVTVDESTWHPVFSKGKWFDLRIPILNRQYFPAGLAGIGPNDNWSVDNPHVWKELSFCLELANRWLRRMVLHDWINHLVYVPREEWFEAVAAPGDLLSKHNCLGPNKKPWRIPNGATGYDGEATLQTIARMLDGKLVWTFFDEEYHLSINNENFDLYGWCNAKENNDIRPAHDKLRENRFVSIHLHVAPLRVLLNPDSTLAERCRAIFQLSTTILHELMHAINTTKVLGEPFIPPEPYYGDEWDSELGRSGIASLFGYDISKLPSTTMGGKRGYKFGSKADDFPAPPGNHPVYSVDDNRAIYLGQVSKRYPLPIAWTSSVLLQTFYDDVVQKYGIFAFRPPKLFEQQCIYRGFYSRAYRSKNLATAGNMVLGGSVDGLENDLAKTLQDLEQRRLIWRHLRPWYDEEYSLWQLTPYSNVEARNTILRFRESVRIENRIRDPIGAEVGASYASLSISYWACSHSFGPLDEPFPRSHWFFSALAHMMQAALPVRRFSQGVYPTRTVPNLWLPSEAAKQEGTDRWHFGPTRLLYEQHTKTWMIPDRHKQLIPVLDQTGTIVDWKSNRAWLLEQAVQLTKEMETYFPIPQPLSLALHTQLQSMITQAFSGNGLTTQWLDFNFKFPEYSKDLVTRDGTGNYTPYTGTLSPSILPDDYDHSPGTTVIAAAQVVPGRRRGSSLRLAQPKRRYFTVSEVGEKTSDNRMGTNWALVADGQGGYDVFDVSDILMNDSSLEIKDVFERTDLGRKVVSRRLLKAIKREGLAPVGRLLMWKHLQEVSENDGQDGRDLWCVVGNYVYDITDFPFRSEAEKEALIALTTKNEPQGLALEDIVDADLLRRLAPYKCGFLRQAPLSGPLQRRTFTLRELGRHIYPELGLYCAIDGSVYDLKLYFNSHPGGSQILCEFAGRDATREFQDAHPDWVATLEAHSVLKIGRIVEERPRDDDINDDEIALVDKVYRINSLEQDNPSLLNNLQPYVGTDATDYLKQPDGPNCLVQLLHMEDLVFAKLVDAVPRHITVAELKQRTALPASKAERREVPTSGDMDWRVWVAVGRAVYDVTAMMMFGSEKEQEMVRPWLGKEVQNAELAALLRTRYEGWVIGQLVRDESGGVSARKAQVGWAKPLGRRRSVARPGLKRRVGELDGEDLEIMRRSNLIKARR